MGAHNSKTTWRSLSSLERKSSKKKYLQAHNATPANLANGTSSIEDKAAQELPPFTDRQRELVVDTWKVVQADIARVGVAMFVKLFETHPEVQSVFVPFRGQGHEDLACSSQLESHAVRVMSTVSTCLLHVHDTAHLQRVLSDLGARHVMYNAKVDYMDLIGPQFIWAIEPVLGEQWTPEVEQAWSDLFKVISHIMKSAMTF